MTEILGWVATAVFVASYFFAKPAALRAVQMVGATLWIIYGCLIGAIPVIAANALVFAAAAWTVIRARMAPAVEPAGEHSKA
ncbi:MAG: YgjV family protein [Gammaproteobacteria bacterium]